MKKHTPRKDEKSMRSRDDSRRGLCPACGRYTVPTADNKCFVCGATMLLKKKK